MKKDDIPPDIAAKVLFQSDRTCCVCRARGKSIQIHHIDGNKSNHDINNLAILCLECHTETQITGGFSRKLDEEQIILYRNDWVLLVARERASAVDFTKTGSDDLDFELITTELEKYKDSKQYLLLAITYDIIGNKNLRDKYIELALKSDKTIETEIFLRALQDKIDIVNPRRIQREITRMKKSKEWEQLARLYVDIKDYKEAAYYYCKGISESLEVGNVFSSAYYIKELSEKQLYKTLFEKAYKQFTKKGDLWWQVRCLQELEWDSELDSLIKSKKKEIEESGDPLLLELLYVTTGDRENLVKLKRNLKVSVQKE